MSRLTSQHSRLEPWMIRFRAQRFWWAVKSAYRMFGLWGAIKNIKHNLAQPRKGCSCSFCFYSKRRRFPPGHPENHVQIRMQFDKRLDEHIRAVRIRDEQRHNRVWGGS